MSVPVDAAEAREIVAALRTGVVPSRGLQHFATGLDPLLAVVRGELEEVAAGEGNGRVKWIRGPYGSGKTFASRLLCVEAQAMGFATTQVQISVTDTPLGRLETVYRRLMERLATSVSAPSAFPAIVDAWLYQLGDEVMRLQGIGENDPAFPEAVAARLGQRFTALSRSNPSFARVLQAYQAAQSDGDFGTARALLAWLSGDPTVAASVKRVAAVRGEVDGPAALAFLRGVAQIIRDGGHRGLVIVLDEVETVQRMRSDSRERALNALRQLVDMLLAGELPGVYLVVTGTPDFFDGYNGLRALPPLAARVTTKFGADPRHDNLRAPQVRLLPFDAERLVAVAHRIRDLYPASAPERIAERVDDAFIAQLVERTTTAFGGQVAVAPRLFLRELVDVMDRVDLHETYDPAHDYAFEVSGDDLTPEELAARGAAPPAASAAPHRLA